MTQNKVLVRNYFQHIKIYYCSMKRTVLCHVNNLFIVLNDYLDTTLVCIEAIGILKANRKDNRMGISLAFLGNEAIHNLHDGIWDNNLGISLAFVCNGVIDNLHDGIWDNNLGISLVFLGNVALHNRHGSNMGSMMDMVFQIRALKIQHFKVLNM